MTVGILGGTGSSKPTLIQLISRLYDTTEGSVRVGGVDAQERRIHGAAKERAVLGHRC